MEYLGLGKKTLIFFWKIRFKLQQSSNTWSDTIMPISQSSNGFLPFSLFSLYAINIVMKIRAKTKGSQKKKEKKRRTGKKENQLLPTLTNSYQLPPTHFTALTVTNDERRLSEATYNAHSICLSVCLPHINYRVKLDLSRKRCQFEYWTLSKEPPSFSGLFFFVPSHQQQRRKKQSTIPWWIQLHPAAAALGAGSKEEEEEIYNNDNQSLEDGLSLRGISSNVFDYGRRSFVSKPDRRRRKMKGV